MDPRRALAEKEEIRYQTKKHWAVFLKAAFYFGLMAAVLAYKEPIRKAIPYAQEEALKAAQAPAPMTAKPKTPAVGEEGRNAAAPGVPPMASPKDPLVQDDFKRFLVPVVSNTVKVVSFALAATFGLLGLARLLSFFSNTVLVTDRRMILNDVLSGSLTSLDVKLVESMRAVTGPLGSLLGYGTVRMVMSSGQKVAIANLRKPHELERELFAAK